jgi:ATPase, P-type (transporting), HAD superfamily, subfamily IC/heavy metal translocating P-type ATPase
MAAALRVVHETRGRLRCRLSGTGQEQVALAARVEELAGIRSVRFNPACRSLVVEYDSHPAVRAAILAAARPSPGGEVVPATPLSETDAPDLAQVVLSGGVMLASLLLPPPVKGLLTAANVAGVVVRGLRALTSRGLTVEVLDALAMSLPLLRREYGTANFARFLLDLGGYIENSTAQRSDHLLRDLLRAEPDAVWIEAEDGQVVEVAYSQVTPGTRVVVGTGNLIPVDGVVFSGNAYVNQAAVTGESLPIPREQGDEVLSGSVVEDGRLVILAERVGSSTTTARISRYIQEALANPTGIQGESRKMADRRVLVTLASGAAVFALTRDWRRLESVFLVDYSCAVKFGTPIAIKAAMFRAAKDGCLVKSGLALETVAAVDTVVFDKTGTLTHNTLEVTDIHCLPSGGVNEQELLAMVASVAEHTSHPIASAVVSLASQRHLAHISHEEVDFIVGHGVASTVKGRTIRLGSRHYLEEHEGVSFHRSDRLVNRLMEEGKSLLFVSADGKPLGIIGLRDRVRDEAFGVLEALRGLGVRQVVMITGDHREKALQLGESLKLDRVFHDQKPEDKAQIVEDLKAEGRTVAFVGDGVNDGPALMAAHVGIAMPRAADIARATADIVLLEDRLESLVALRALAGDTMRLIRSNFKASVGINSAIMAGAALGKLAPAATALLHNGTTIAILLRALASSRARRRVRP